MAPSRLLSLPAELRLIIYSYCLVGNPESPILFIPHHFLSSRPSSYLSPSFRLPELSAFAGLYRMCKTLHNEIIPFSTLVIILTSPGAGLHLGAWSSSHPK